MGKWVVGIPHVEAICAAHTQSVFHQFWHGELTMQLRFAEREVPEISKQAEAQAQRPRTRGSLSFSRNVNHLHAPTVHKNVDSTEPKSKRSGPRSQRNPAGARVQSEHTDYKVWPHVHAGIESDHTWTEFDYKVTLLSQALTNLHKKLNQIYAGQWCQRFKIVDTAYLDWEIYWWG